MEPLERVEKVGECGDRLSSSGGKAESGGGEMELIKGAVRTSYRVSRVLHLTALRN